MPPEIRLAVVVLGMHRGGTSLAARALQALGVNLGSNFIPADGSNPSGYWENAAILGFNDRLLARHGMTWDAVCAPPHSLAEDGEARSGAGSLLDAEFGEYQAFGFKDPRTCRLLGFWRPVFADMSVDDRYLLVLRHPDDIVASLQARRRISRAEGLLLYALHFLEAIEGSKGRPRVLMEYDELVASPRRSLGRIGEALGLTPDAAGVEQFCSDFVDSGLRHQREDGRIGATDVVSETVIALHDAIQTVARGHGDFDSPAVVRASGAARALLSAAAPLLEASHVAGGRLFRVPARGALMWAARIDPRQPEALCAGETLCVEVICVNEGTRAWNPPRPDGPHLRLSYHVRAVDGAMLSWDNQRTPIESAVEPGAGIRLQANFVAPAEPGEYLIEWDMLSEWECWFQSAGSRTATVRLRVTPHAEVEPARYPVTSIPGGPWSPRFRKPASEVQVAVAVRTWNVLRHGRRDLLERTLASLRAGERPFDLVVVDNGSTDGTADLVTAMGGHAAPALPGGNPAGHGMNIAIERALGRNPDLIVFSDDDVEWRPGFLQRLVDFWAHAPHDLALVSCFVERRWSWNTVRGAIDCGGMRAIVRETAAGGAWAFPAEHWGWFGPLKPEMDADWEACQRLRRRGLRLAQADLAVHIGADRSTWGNAPEGGAPLEDAMFSLPR